MMLLLFLAPLAVHGDSPCNFLQLMSPLPTPVPTAAPTNFTNATAPTPMPVDAGRRRMIANDPALTDMILPDGYCHAVAVNNTAYSESFSCDGSDVVYTQFLGADCDVGGGSSSNSSNSSSSNVLVEQVLATYDTVSLLAHGDWIVGDMQCGAADCRADMEIYGSDDCGESGADDELLDASIAVGVCTEYKGDEMYTFQVSCCDNGSGVQLAHYATYNCSGDAVEAQVVGAGECSAAFQGVDGSTMYLSADFNCTGTEGTSAEVDCTAMSGNGGVAAGMTGGQIAAVVIFSVLALAATCYCVYTGSKHGGPAVPGGANANETPLVKGTGNGYQATEQTE